MMQSFFLFDSLSIIQVIRLNEEKTWNRPQKDCNAINLLLFMVILYSKLTKVCDMEDSFENDVVIFCIILFPLFQSWD